MQGSYSIKKVLPALVQELSYSNLNIQDGAMASGVFAAIVLGEFVGGAGQVRRHLREYGGVDMVAMVEILRKLRSGRGFLKCVFAFLIILTVL